MNRNLRTRSIIIAVLTALCLIVMFGPWHRTGKSAGDFFKPSKLKENLSENIKLGLDLRGGTHLVMQVQADDAIKAITDGNVLKTDSELKKANIPFTAVKSPANGVVVVETPDSSKHSEIRSEEHTSELQSLRHLVCRLLLEKKKNKKRNKTKSQTKKKNIEECQIINKHMYGISNITKQRRSIRRQKKQ